MLGVELCLLDSDVRELFGAEDLDAHRPTNVTQLQWSSHSVVARFSSQLLQAEAFGQELDIQQNLGGDLYQGSCRVRKPAGTCCRGSRETGIAAHFMASDVLLCQLIDLVGVLAR